MKKKKQEKMARQVKAKPPKPAVPPAPAVGCRPRFDQLLDDAIFGIKKK